MNCVMLYILISVLMASVALNLFYVFVVIRNLRKELDYWRRKDDDWDKYWRAYYEPAKTKKDEKDEDPDRL